MRISSGRNALLLHTFVRIIINIIMHIHACTYEDRYTKICVIEQDMCIYIDDKHSFVFCNLIDRGSIAEDNESSSEEQRTARVAEGS